MIRVLAIAAAGLLACGSAIAEKPTSSGGATTKIKHAGYFGEQRRTMVRDYYNEQMRAGICPIGFAKKEDGCVAPAHTRKWAVGKPLPSSAIRFDLPAALTGKLGKPPAGHRYVRIGPDILLVSNKTKLVTEGITDLGRR